MKKLFLSFVLVGWFFNATMSLGDYPGAKIIAHYGPFASDTDCGFYREMTMDIFQQLELKVKFDVCVEEKRA